MYGDADLQLVKVFEVSYSLLFIRKMSKANFEYPKMQSSIVWHLVDHYCRLESIGLRSGATYSPEGTNIVIKDIIINCPVGPR